MQNLCLLVENPAVSQKERGIRNWTFEMVTMIDVTGTIACAIHNYLNYTVTVTPPACSIHLLLPKFLGHHLVKLKKMFFGKHFWQSLTCFVIGGIITVIFIKILEWQRDQNNEELGDNRILVPVQEVGDGEREEPMKIRKIPREQDDLRY